MWELAKLSIVIGIFASVCLIGLMTYPFWFWLIDKISNGKMDNRLKGGNKRAESRGRSSGSRTCRGCSSAKGDMAIEYGDDEGLCRECLNKYLPLGLKAGQIEEKEGKGK